MDKIREIAVLKLIGTKNRTIVAMIMQQALALGVIGFIVGKITAHGWRTAAGSHCAGPR
jgi:putative ABC transport system permease protein